MPVTSPRQSETAYPVAPRSAYGQWDDLLREGDFQAFNRALIDWLRSISSSLFGVMQGKTNNVTTLTLTQSTASTTLTDIRVRRPTAVILVPTTANASAEIGAGTIYQTYPNATEGQAVINHANNAQADRTFIAVFIG